MHCYTDEAEVHKNGLLEMVKSAGGLDKLGFDGFLARLITLYEFVLLHTLILILYIQSGPS
jgi:hypothetical protein